ncbi:MAG: class IV lanthionine synthetase LanL [Actinomycetota bacterium]|nr:class IV lanthionine synthetase LanL [Actinomycetota bacterium]
MRDAPTNGLREHPPELAADSQSLVAVVHDALRSRGDEDAWEVTSDGLWCRVTPRGHRWPSQGWKLHVSTTLPLAGTVLARALPVLLEARCAFKFAGTRENVALLNSNHAPRGGSGKFLTVYPDSDSDAADLAAALHQATAGLAGPLILSDRPYAPGSLVHYRYGSFSDQRVLSNDDLYQEVVYAPSGEPVQDRREARFTPPAWAPSPFPVVEATPKRTAPSSTPRAILLNDRFIVGEAIRHANKGGVYRAREIHDDTEVVIKEARPNVAVTPTGTDARDALRAEARHLDVLAPLGVSPRVIELFEQGGHLFLAEELVAGTALRHWVLDRVRQSGMGAHLPGALQMAQRLVTVLRAAHDAGLVLRDFNPNNLMVHETGELRLLDLELAVPVGEQVDYVVGGTPGYSAPEQMDGSPPAVQADYFSLGATICFVLTGADPLLPEDRPVGRPLRERLACWLASGTPENDLPETVRALLVGLMDDRPDHRTTPAEGLQVLQACGAQLSRAGRVDKGSAGTSPIPAGTLHDTAWDEAVDGIVGHLLATMNPGDPEQLWPLSSAGPSNDPCNVQHGAAGVLGVLARCFELTGDERLPDTIATTCAWIERRLRADTFRPPGLYFGRAGIAWALHEAGRVLGDDGLARRALRLAASLPTQWPNPDLTHGTAGLGLTSLQLWRATGDEEHAERARRSADALLAAAAEGHGGLGWATPSSFDSVFAGERYYGFAHGNAGIGYFLLVQAASGGGRDCVVAAEHAAETLLATMISGDGAARWCEGPGHEEIPLPYWCTGSSGVGSFLLRLSRVTGGDRARKAAEMAAEAVVQHSWAGPVGQCHGLAGNADFLLDMADALGEPRYEAWAHHLARAVFARRVYREGRAVFPDAGGDLSADWADGLSGVLAFLLRLRHRGPRLWMADPSAWEVQS